MEMFMSFYKDALGLAKDLMNQWDSIETVATTFITAVKEIALALLKL